MRNTRAAVVVLGAILSASSVSLADLFVVDSDVVKRFDSTTGAVVQTGGVDAFTTLLGATGITVGPDGRVYVGTSNPGFGPELPVVNRYNQATGAQVGGPFVPFTNGASQVSNPQGMVFGPNGNLYIADLGDNGPVQVFDSAGSYVTTYATTGGNAQAVTFRAGSPGSIYVATGGAIEQIDLASHNDTILIQGNSNAFSNAVDRAFGQDGKLYVLDTGAGSPKIWQYNADGTGQTVFADFNNPNFLPAVFQPTNMAFGPDGHLYVSGLSLFAATADQGEILRLSSDGSTSTEFVTGLTYPGFLVFSEVPTPGTVVMMVTAGVVVVGRRRRVR